MLALANEFFSASFMLFLISFACAENVWTNNNSIGTTTEQTMLEQQEDHVDFECLM